MEVLLDDVRSVSGVYFRITDTTNLINESGKIIYLLYLKQGVEKNFSILHKFIRMFAIPYRMVLIDAQNQECIGFALLGDEEEQEDLEALMEWVGVSHPEWIVINCQKSAEIPKIIGLRMANNLFHAKKLALHGEVLD